MNRIIILLSFLFFQAQCFSQVLNGQITTKNSSPIVDVEVALTSTLGDQGPSVSANSDDDGKFSIQVTKQNIDDVKKEGANWKLFVFKEGYKKVVRNILIDGEEIIPNNLIIKLETDPFTPFHSMVDDCVIQDPETITMYLFDLKKSSTDDDISTHLDVLAHKVNSEIINHFVSFNLSGGLKLELARCSGFEVKDKRYALHYGERLEAEGVIWGSSQVLDSINTVISLTYLDNPPLLGMTSVSFSKNIEDIIDLSKSSSKEYLAFSTYVLGKAHQKKGNEDLAIRCFKHAKALNALPGEYMNSISESIDILESTETSHLINSLQPIDN